MKIPFRLPEFGVLPDLTDKVLNTPEKMAERNIEYNTVYLTLDNEGYFEVRGLTEDGTKIGIRTNDIKKIIHCIKSVMNTLYLSNRYGELATGFISGEDTYEEFVKKIGGREKHEPRKWNFPIEIL